MTDGGNTRIQVFDSDGNHEMSFGSRGNDDGKFSNPQGIAIDSANNTVYVADTANNRIQVFDSDGNHQDVIWQSQGNGDGEF